MSASITWQRARRRGMHPQRVISLTGLVLGLAFGACLCACRGSEREALSSGLVLRTLPDCAPDRVERLVVEPLGDFALQGEAAQASDLSDERIVFTGLPAESAWFRLRVETPDPSYRAFALGPVAASGQTLDALVLPLARTCSVLERTLSSFEASALALVAGEDLLLAGGVNASGEATRAARIVRVAAGELALDARGLDVQRARASAVTLGSETWVLGGAFDQRDGTLALDTFDRFDARERAFVGLGRLRAPRVAPAVLALLDGSLLLAGGLRSVGGEPLASIEVVSASTREAESWDSALPLAAAELVLLQRDDGRVLALAVAEGETQLASLDPRVRSVDSLRLPALAAGASLKATLAVALPGGRVALLEAEALTGKTTGSMFVMLDDDSYLKIADPREASEPSWLTSFAGIEQGRLLALPDGRVLLTGVRQDVPVARLLDPGRRDVAARALDIKIERLFLRADGSALLVGPGGVRILREDARSPFDNPGGNLLADDSGALCLDGYGRFEREGLGLRASVPQARLDLVALRYRDVSIRLTVEGPAELLLRRADGSFRSIALDDENVGPAFCKLPVQAGQTIEIERREQRITLRAGKRSLSCQLDGMTGPISLALRALSAGVGVRDLRATRL